VEGHFAADIRQAAAYGLSEDHPHASAREGLTFRQRAGLAASVLTSLLAAWAWPAATLAILAALFGVLFLTSLVLRLATLREIFTEKTVQPRRRIADRDLPIYSILAPLFRETRVLPQFVAALKGLDYPPAKLDIKIILEEDDAPMRDAVAALGLPANFEIVIAPRGWPQTKPRALNVALSTARGEFLVIYDAEDRPDPGQLRAALAAFATGGAELACLQGRLVIDNADDTWLTRLFAIDYAALFGILVPGLARMDLPIMLGGTTNHFRTAVLRRVGGWDAFNVTEDADLGFRLARQGFRVGALESETLEEAPVALRAWMRQRTRWMKGWLQTTFVHARRPRQALHSMGAIGYGACLALCCGTVAASLLGPIFLAFACYDIAFGEVTRPAGWVSLIVSSLTLTLFFSGLLITAAQLIAGMRRQGLTQFWPWLFVYPAYLALVSLASWRALFEFITAPHYWHKTEHGLARTSRRKANDGIGGLEFNAAGPPHDLGTPKRI
jgi:cellulose synthase/poly-beta-1,6-N-acetylglucosamine synthase-like glycosyltransferase